MALPHRHSKLLIHRLDSCGGWWSRWQLATYTTPSRCQEVLRSVEVKSVPPFPIRFDMIWLFLGTHSKFRPALLLEGSLTGLAVEECAAQVGDKTPRHGPPGPCIFLPTGQFGHFDHVFRQSWKKLAMTQMILRILYMFVQKLCTWEDRKCQKDISEPKAWDFGGVIYTFWLIDFSTFLSILYIIGQESFAGTSSTCNWYAATRWHGETFNCSQNLPNRCGIFWSLRWVGCHWRRSAAVGRWVVEEPWRAHPSGQPHQKWPRGGGGSQWYGNAGWWLNYC